MVGSRVFGMNGGGSVVGPGVGLLVGRNVTNLVRNLGGKVVGLLLVHLVF